MRKRELRHFACAIDLWTRGFDTARIAAELKVHEAVIERWVWSFREAVRATSERGAAA